MLILGRPELQCTTRGISSTRFGRRHKCVCGRTNFLLASLCGRKQKPETRGIVSHAHTGQSSSDRTIKSLESLLGSSDDVQDEDDSDAEKEPDGYDRPRRVPDAAERRVRPLYVYVIYYCFIVVYLAAAWLQATDGDVAASILADGLVNDHLAVASGQVPRLATAGFVCNGPLELFLQLATLLTVGAEAEALLGYSLFWAVYWLANLGGGLADAAFSELPVTYGPANAAAGMVGALVAYYVRNAGLEERIAAARQAVRRRRRQILDGVGSDSSQSVDASRDSLEDTETEVEVLPLLSFTFTSRLRPEAKALLNVLVALVMAGQGLLDLGEASSNASWIGLIAAFWTGMVLTYGAGPQYEVKFSLPDFPSYDGGGSDSSSTAAATAGVRRPGAPTTGNDDGGSYDKDAKAEQQLPRTATAATSGTGGGQWRLEVGATRSREPLTDDDGLAVVDVCPRSRRQAVLAGYVVGLTGLILGWLAWMGTDI